MMVDDYETGLHRGRATRHHFGRLRWLLVGSLFVNAFLSYKVWSYRSQLFELQSVSDVTQKRMMEKNIKTNDIISILQMEKEKCDKYLSDSKDLLNECESSRKQCSVKLDSASSKLMDTSDSLRKLEVEKGQVDEKLEKCEEELQELRELTQKLKTDISEEQRKNEVLTDRAIDHQTTIEKPIEPIQEIKGPETEPNDTIGSNVNEIENANEEKTPNDEEPAPVFSTFIKCLFNDDKEGQNCTYHNVPESPSWKLGHPVFLSQFGGDQDDKDILCIYVDDSLLSGSDASIVFESIKSSLCIEVALTFSTLESGFIVVEDNEQSYELGASDDPDGWRTQKFLFKQSPSHLVKITGRVPSKGGAAIASIAVTEAKCSVTIVDDGDHEIEKDEDDGDDDLDQIVQ